MEENAQRVRRKELGVRHEKHSVLDVGSIMSRVTLGRFPFMFNTPSMSQTDPAVEAD